MNKKRWVIPRLDKESAAQLAEDYGIDPFLALMLVTRGMSDLESAEAFLQGDEPEDPFAFADMDIAVDRISAAIDSGEAIAVYGDYDVDGITSTAVVYLYLRDKGADVRYYLPHREKEGYGMSRTGIDFLAAAGVKLIITVDNGISAASEVAYAAQLGIDVVITDHHQPPETLPAAVAVIDPHRRDCESGFKEYAGVGVAYKLVCALEGDTDDMLEQYGDLVALGTLADVVELRGENRMLVREGLRLLNSDRRPGLKLLRAAAGAADQELKSVSAAFSLVPRLNAPGRMDSPAISLELLLCGDDDSAGELAAQVQQYNVDRQSAETGIYGEISERIEASPGLVRDRVIVIDGQGWNPGVIGIIAARIVERYGKPCILLSVSEGEAKGSGRSVRGFNLHAAVKACAETLDRYGGHELAVGVGLGAEQITLFREKINEYAAGLYPVMPSPELVIDFKLIPSQADIEKVALIELMEPFGAGNPPPVFGLFNMRIDNIVPVGQGKHLRLSVSRDETRLSVMRFRMTVDEFPFECGQMVDLVVSLERNEFRGAVSVSIFVKDMRACGVREEELLSACQQFDRFMRGEALTAAEREEWNPRREDLERIYRFLRTKKEWAGSPDVLACVTGAPDAPYIRLMLALQALCEAGLIEMHDRGDAFSVRICPVSGKADLEQTPVMKRLRG